MRATTPFIMTEVISHWIAFQHTVVKELRINLKFWKESNLINVAEVTLFLSHISGWT